jgi:hypothetical protein
MARNDPRRFSFDAFDRAPPREGANSPTESWRALANAAVASILVTALVVSGLALCETAFSTSTVKLARQAPAASQLQPWYARTPSSDPFLPTPMQAEPALLVTD